MGGIKFLKEVRSDEELNASVVFVLTTSSAEKDICSAYEHQVAGYITKEDAGNSFMKAIGMLEHYSKVVQFPV